ncbi:hypothetical protein LPY66_11340 [Dehalobacter sp. DCM]|uniref:hypothetical protein n=1 Tax=Dehalobacter sp. DCM TaxID=2907827 RepID=UPI0030819718|nr:hypothetical protein LPY66_11340 [Dehalobacter sp. DCM]
MHLDIEKPRVETMVFRASLAAGAKQTYKERIKSDGTVEKVRIKIYPGSEGTLKIRPCVFQKGRRSLVDLLTYPDGGNQYMSGDDDYFEFPVVMSVQNDDEIYIICENAGSYPYTVSVDVVIDYFGGKDRIIGGVL